MVDNQTLIYHGIETQLENGNGSGNMNFVYIVISVVGVSLFVLICVIIVVIIKKRRQPRHLRDLLHCEVYNDPTKCKSAPISRSSSPSREKRRSCPNAYGTIEESLDQATTPDVLPHFDTTRVQPKSGVEKSKSTTALQYLSSSNREHPQLPDLSESKPARNGDTSGSSIGALHGRIWFTLQYDEVKLQLLVTIVKIRKLQGRGEGQNNRDPFVRVFLLPDENVYRTSRVLKKTTNPNFNETFTFDISKAEICHRKLRFSVYDLDTRRLRHTLGHAVVPLEDIDLSSLAILSKDLEAEIPHAPFIGELNVSLSYLPHLERLKLVIIGARNIGHPFDPDAEFFSKVQFYYGNKLIKTKQTLSHIAGNELNFNESFSFRISGKNIENFSFILSLMQKTNSNLSQETELGHVTLGSFMHARGGGLIHWQAMLAKSRSTVTQWHPLCLPV